MKTATLAFLAALMAVPAMAQDTHDGCTPPAPATSGPQSFPPGSERMSKRPDLAQSLRDLNVSDPKAICEMEMEPLPDKFTPVQKPGPAARACTPMS